MVGIGINGDDGGGEALVAYDVAAAEAAEGGLVGDRDGVIVVGEFRGGWEAALGAEEGRVNCCGGREKRRVGCGGDGGNWGGGGGCGGRRVGVG